MSENKFKEEIKKIVKSKVPDVKDSDLDLHHDSAFYWGAQNLKSASDWILKTVSIIENPGKFGDQEAFINFFGIIDDSELYSFLREKGLRSYELLGIERKDVEAFIGKNQDPNMKDYLMRIWNAFLLIENLRKSFSDDERFMLRFIRHRYCHLRLSNFSVKIEGYAEDAQFKTSNWERLVVLSKNNRVSDLRKTFTEKLLNSKDELLQIAKLINADNSDTIFPV